MNSCPLKVKPKPWLIGTLIAAIAASGGIVLVGLAQSGWQTPALQNPVMYNPQPYQILPL